MQELAHELAVELVGRELVAGSVGRAELASLAAQVGLAELVEPAAQVGRAEPVERVGRAELEAA